MRPGRTVGKVARWVGRGLWPNQRLRVTREGVGYGLIWLGLLAMGLYQQLNLLLLVAGLAAGPIAASFVTSSSMLRGVAAARRSPAFVISGDDLTIDYTLENRRPWTAVLAMTLDDLFSPVDRVVSGSDAVEPTVFFARVPGRGKARLRWQGVSPRRGRYRASSFELVTRFPFGLLERRQTVEAPAQIVVYPTVGRLTRRWHQLYRETTQTRRGKRHDRTAQQQEYHGLRDYRPDDSPRWIHWRTTARLGRPMIKEFEQQQEQDFALLIDPWMPRHRATPAQRDRVEEVIRFAATVSLEICRHPGRKFLLGWAGPSPAFRHGQASVKLLHEILEQLAVMRPVSEGHVARLFDLMPPAMLREAILVLASTRPIHLEEEFARSERLSERSGRSIPPGRILQLDASRGDLAEFVSYDRLPSSSSRNGEPEGSLTVHDSGEATPEPTRSAASMPTRATTRSNSR